MALIRVNKGNASDFETLSFAHVNGLGGSYALINKDYIEGSSYFGASSTNPPATIYEHSEFLTCTSIAQSSNNAVFSFTVKKACTVKQVVSDGITQGQVKPSTTSSTDYVVNGTFTVSVPANSSMILSIS